MRAPLQIDPKISSRTPPTFTPAPRGLLQRKCACGGTPGPTGECQACRAKKLQRRSENLDLSSISDPPSSISEVPSIVHEVLRSSGQPLDASTRVFMEPRFGHDFSQVRLHVGKAAKGKRLTVNQAGDQFEQEADQVATAVMRQPDTNSPKERSEPQGDYDFSQVRIHTDAQAAAAARAVHALAYTAGRHIVFGQGRYRPNTRAGSKLIAHELTHVMQQSGLEFVAGQSIKGRHQVAGTSPITGVIARQPASPEPGWSDEKGLNKGVTTVNAKGEILTGKIESGKSKGVWRVPLQGLHLEKGDKGQAIALIPNAVNSSAPAGNKNMPVDVLLHLHGFGAGYRELKSGEHDYAGVLQAGQLRDVELYKMEQQLLPLASKRFTIAVLPQGSEKSRFGDLSSKSDVYLKEVFDKLGALNLLPKGAILGRVIVSGHSGGGPTAIAIANQRAKAGKRTGVLLFDAINSRCTEREPVIKDGKQVLDKGGNPKTKCKTCASNEYGAAKKWVTDKIYADISGLSEKPEDQKTELQTNGTRFRGFTSESLTTTNTCSYGFWYNKLKNDIETTIKKLTVSENAKNQLRQNYLVSEVQGPHERVMAHGSLEAALKD
jgi:hypothetical protein